MSEDRSWSSQNQSGLNFCLNIEDRAENRTVGKKYGFLNENLGAVEKAAAEPKRATRRTRERAI